MTWIEVIDSAVKIGLGAVIAGIITFVLSSIQHRNELKRAKVEREFEMLKEVAEKVELFNRVVLRYWALATDWRRKLPLEQHASPPDRLLDIQDELFDIFSELTKAESLLLLFGYNDASVKLREYGESVITFKKRVESVGTPFNKHDAAEHRELIINKRNELFSLLNEIYKKI